MEITHDPSEYIKGLQQLLISDKKRIGFLFGAGSSMAKKDENSLIKDIVIDFPVGFLINLFQINIEDDPNVYKGYLINKEQFLQLLDSVPELSKFDFSNFL